MTSVKKGQAGEQIATQFLEKKGYKIIDRNVRSRVGEIDLIGLDPDGETLVFIEVKRQRSGAFFDAGYLVGAQKQRRIRKTADWYLLKHGKKYDTYYKRFDVVILEDILVKEYIRHAF